MRFLESSIMCPSIYGATPASYSSVAFVIERVIRQLFYFNVLPYFPIVPIVNGIDTNHVWIFLWPLESLQASPVD